MPRNTVGPAGIAKLVLVAALAASCASGSDQSTEASLGETVVDTIGDTMVVRTVGARDEAAALQLTPEVTIGVVDGAEEYQFASIDELAAASDGSMYVWDGALGLLRQYDSAGHFVRVIGGQGGGPGEYRSSNGIALLPGGRLALWDAQQARVNVYDTSGSFITSWRAASPAMGPRGLDVDSAGGLYLRAPVRDPLFSEAASRGEGLLEVDASTGVPLRFLPTPASGTSPPRISVLGSDGLPIMFRSVPFWPESRWAWSPHGHFLTATGDRYAVVLDRKQAPMRIERDVDPVPLDADERRNVEERVIASFRRRDPGWTWSGPRIPEHKPVVRGLLAGADGRIWVRRWLPGERIPEAEIMSAQEGSVPPLRWRDPEGFDVFEPDGAFVGFVLLPPRTTILKARGDRIWAAVRDSLDVPGVVRFRISRPER